MYNLRDQLVNDGGMNLKSSCMLHSNPTVKSFGSQTVDLVLEGEALMWIFTTRRKVCKKYAKEPRNELKINI